MHPRKISKVFKKKKVMNTTWISHVSIYNVGKKAHEPVSIVHFPSLTVLCHWIASATVFTRF